MIRRLSTGPVLISALFTISHTTATAQDFRELRQISCTARFATICGPFRGCGNPIVANGALRIDFVKGEAIDVTTGNSGKLLPFKKPTGIVYTPPGGRPVESTLDGFFVMGRQFLVSVRSAARVRLEEITFHWQLDKEESHTMIYTYYVCERALQ